MNRRLISVSIVALFVALAVPALAFADEQVDNPQFKAWSSYGVGSSATMSVEMQGMPVKVTFLQKLVEKAADHVVIEVSSITEINGAQHASPPTKRTINSKTNKTNLDESSTTTEDIAVAGKTFKCKVFQMKGASAQAPDALSKVWFSSEVPGGMVKVEVNSAGRTVTMMLLSYEAK